VARGWSNLWQQVMKNRRVATGELPVRTSPVSCIVSCCGKRKYAGGVSSPAVACGEYSRMATRGGRSSTSSTSARAALVSCPHGHGRATQIPPRPCAKGWLPMLHRCSQGDRARRTNLGHHRTECKICWRALFFRGHQNGGSHSSLLLFHNVGRGLLETA
jgi:hypothetical protein